MKRFHFRLASVLSIRRRLEDHRARALAQAGARASAEERTLVGARERLAGDGEALIARLHEGASAPEASRLAGNVAGHRHAAAASIARLAERQAETTAARTALVHAARDRRALERLEDVRR